MAGYSGICVRDIFNDTRFENIGSPLVSESNELIGIASYFGDSFDFGDVAIYIRISQYIPWIRAILADG